MSVEVVIAALIGVLLGAVVSFVWQRPKLTLKAEQVRDLEGRLEQEKAARLEELSRQKESFEARILDLRMTAENIQQSFSHVATQVLDQNASKFQEYAAKDLKNMHQAGASELDKRNQFFDQTVKEMAERIKDSQEKISVFEKERSEMYTRLESQMASMFEQERRLVQETERLKTALTTSHSVRGRWGELVLRNILKSSDLVEGIDYEEQSLSQNDMGGGLKPDFLIKLPQEGQQLVIDCKTSILDAFNNEPTEGASEGLQSDFYKKVRERVLDLASKEYQKNVTDSAPYVIMFIPSEAAIRSAFDSDPDLFQWAMAKKVFIASPATIIPLILLISKAWNEFKLSSEAKELSKVVEQLGSRLQKFVDRLCKMQRGLDTAVKSWNEAIDVSWNGKQGVQKSIDRAKELGGRLSEIKALEHAADLPRVIETDEDGEVEETVL